MLASTACCSRAGLQSMLQSGAYSVRDGFEAACGSLHNSSVRCLPIKWRLPLADGIPLRASEGVRASPRTLGLPFMRAWHAARVTPAAR